MKIQLCSWVLVGGMLLGGASLFAASSDTPTAENEFAANARMKQELADLTAQASATQNQILECNRAARTLEDTTNYLQSGKKTSLQAERLLWQESWDGQGLKADALWIGNPKCGSIRAWSPTPVNCLVIEADDENTESEYRTGFSLPRELVEGRRIIIAGEAAGHAVASFGAITLWNNLNDGSSQWAGVHLPQGDFDWTPFRFEATVPYGCKFAALVLGLEGDKGSLRGALAFRNITVSELE